MRAALLVGAALAGVAGRWALGSDAAPDAGGFRCTVASITDGDTLRCREEGRDGRQIRVRIAGIAARERNGSCRPGHPCPAASAEASTAELARLASGQTLTCHPEGSTFGRVAAFCTNEEGADLSCSMVERGAASRWARYWRDHACP